MGTSRSSTAYRPAILLVAFLSWGSAAAGGSMPEASRATEAIRVELDAPGACGNAAAFFDAVRARTPNVRPSQGDPGERLFSVQITESDRAFDGTLRVVDPAGQGSERTLSAESCQELIEALAIITALAVDPDSGSAAGPPENGEAPGAVTPPSPAVSPAPRDEPARPVPPRAPKNSLPLSWFLGAGAGVDRLPGALLFPTGSLTLEGGVVRRSVFSPSVRLALRRSLEATLTSGSGSAALALTTARLEICPLRVQWMEALRFLPCAVVDGGVLEARGQDVRGAQSHARPWWTAGLAGRLSIGATSPRVDLELGAVVPLNPDTFRFTPDEFVYSATGLAAFAAAGISFAL